MANIMIEPTEEHCHLRLREGRSVSIEDTKTVTKWLARQARIQGRKVNYPSFTIRVDRDVVARVSYVNAWVDSFPGWLSEWVESYRVRSEVLLCS